VDGLMASVRSKSLLGRIGLFDFHRAAEAIGHGEDCVAHVLDDLHSMLETLPCAG
jgi:hypothetical protein